MQYLLPIVGVASYVCTGEWNNINIFGRYVNPIPMSGGGDGGGGGGGEYANHIVLSSQSFLTHRRLCCLLTKYHN